MSIKKPRVRTREEGQAVHPAYYAQHSSSTAIRTLAGKSRNKPAPATLFDVTTGTKFYLIPGSGSGSSGGNIKLRYRQPRGKATQPLTALYPTRQSLSLSPGDALIEARPDVVGQQFQVQIESYDEAIRPRQRTGSLTISGLPSGLL